MLERGCCWKVREGCNIRVGKDHWLRDEHNFYISSQISQSLDGIRVNDLIILGCRLWDLELLDLFNEHDMLEITNIPLLLSPVDDRVV